MINRIFLKKLSRISILLSLLSTSLTAWADKYTNLGEVSSNALDIFGNVNQLIFAMAYIIGTGFAVTAVLKYKQHRDNPTQVPLSISIIMLIFALILILMPLLLSGVSASLFGVEHSTVSGPSGTIFK